jgi:acyl-CoA thioesterase FadM
MFSTREVRIVGDEGPLASARQEWVHVAATNLTLEPARGSRALLDAFPAVAGPEGDVVPALPPIATKHDDHAPHVFELESFYGWMDPLDHANHPAYVDWADEALCRALAAANVPPITLVPVAEEATFKSGVTAAERVRVETRVRGRTIDGDVVCDHAISAAGRACATVTTVRRLLDRDASELARAVGRAQRSTI